MATKTVIRRKRAKAAPAERIDPQENWDDVSGDPGGLFTLENEDPTRKYVWAHHTKDGVGEFLSEVIPYRVETLDADGVKPRSGAYGLKAGDEITQRDHILMSCDRALWEKRQRYLNNKNEIQNAQLAKDRQRDTIAGSHHGEWTGLGDR